MTSTGVWVILGNNSASVTAQIPQQISVEEKKREEMGKDRRQKFAIPFFFFPSFPHVSPSLTFMGGKYLSIRVGSRLSLINSSLLHFFPASFDRYLPQLGDN